MNNTVIILFLALIFLSSFGCSGPESIIKNDLNARFTKFEIVEIKSDSSNVWDAGMTLMGLTMNITDGNVEIAKAARRYDDKELSFKEASAYMDSITGDMKNRCMEFMDLMNSKKEPCYYVKYRVFKEELKLEREEYYLIRTYDGNKTEAIHRPCDWNEYLQERGHPDLLAECFEYYTKFLDSFK